MRATLTSVEETAPGAVKVVTTLTVEADGIDKPILVAESIGRFTV